MPTILSFEDFELDELRFELRRRGQLVHVQPKVLRVLLYLVQHRERSVTAEELLNALWPGERVTLASIKRAIGGARRALGERAESQASIRTVRGHGYRFARAVEPSAPPDTPPATTTRASAFVGRSSILALCAQRLAEARAGRGQLVLVHGEPGIGKTRLLQELAAMSAQDAARAWLGRCTHDEGAPALWPFVQIMRAAAAELSPPELLSAMGPGAADIVARFPELQRVCPDLKRPPELGSAAERFRFFDSLSGCFQRIAHGRGLCLLIDDVQHADPLTLRLLSFIAQHLGRSQLLIVMSLRAHPQVPDALEKLLQLSTAHEIELPGLDATELASWMTRHTGSTPTPRQLSYLQEQTAGNPLFVERMLHAGGQDAHAPVRSSTDVQRSLRGVIEQHLSQLTAASQRALRMACVFGRDFSLGPLAMIARTPAAQLAHDLSHAVAAGLLRAHEAQLDDYQFAHALIRDALYAQLSHEERGRLHGLAARALAQQQPISEARLPLLADHYLRATPDDDAERALTVARRAADAALRRGAFEEAAALYERARKRLELTAADPVAQLELSVAQGEALARAGEVVSARGVLHAAALAARELADNDVLVRAVSALAELPESGSVDSACVELIESTLERLARTDPRRACLAALHAKALTYARDRAGCTRIARSALLASRGLCDPKARTQALIACWHGMAEPDCLPERQHIADELARIGHEHADHRALLWSAIAQVACNMERGELAAVDAAVESISTLAEHVRDPRGRWYGMAFRAMRHTLAAELPQAAHWIEAAYRQGLPLGAAGARHVYCTQLATIHRLQGQPAQAEKLVREVSLSHPSIAGWQAVLAGLEAEQGRTEQARRVLERLVERDLAAVRCDPYALTGLAATADLCLRVGDASHALAIYRSLQPYEQRHGSVSVGIASHGPIARHLGSLALQMRDFAAAERHFDRALLMAEAMPSPLFVSMCALSYAHLSIVTRRQLERAHALLSRAFELGRTHDLAGIVHAADGLSTLARSGAVISGKTERASRA